jgi:hypothetical protein
MNRQVARTLTWFYPAWWRERYADEFSVFLEESDAGTLSIAGVIYSAIREHLVSEGGSRMKSMQPALGLVVLSFLAAALGGINLVMTADDSLLVSATRSHPITTMAWDVLAVAAILCGVVVLLTAIRLYRSIIAFAWRNRRLDIFMWLATPFFGVGALILWVTGCMVFAHGRWAPSPWAILGNGAASPFWPSLQARWICGIISVVLIAAVSLASTFGVRRAIRLTDFVTAKKELRNRFAVSASLWITGCTLVMFISVLVWGISLAQNFPDLVRQSLGPLNGTAAASWTISLFLFAIASAVCLRASRSILTGGIAVPE